VVGLLARIWVASDVGFDFSLGHTLRALRGLDTHYRGCRPLGCVTHINFLGLVVDVRGSQSLYPCEC